MDVTHYSSKSNLILIDCGPSLYYLALLKNVIIQQLEGVFFEQRATEKLLTDNATALCSEMFLEFASEWGVHMCFSCAHVPSGNDIVERCHCCKERLLSCRGSVPIQPDI